MGVKLYGELENQHARENKRNSFYHSYIIRGLICKLGQMVNSAFIVLLRVRCGTATVEMKTKIKDSIPQANINIAWTEFPKNLELRTKIVPLKKMMDEVLHYSMSILKGNIEEHCLHLNFPIICHKRSRIARRFQQFLKVSRIYMHLKINIEILISSKWKFLVNQSCFNGTIHCREEISALSLFLWTLLCLEIQ